MQNLFNLFKLWILNQGIEISDKSNAFQCMDLAYSFCFFLQFPKSTIQHLYAYQVFTNPTDTTNTYFQIIPNSDDFVPQVGDIGVFNKTDSNIAGHICICTGEGDINSFHSLDQNWAGQSKVVEIVHSYVNFLGVLRPKLISNEITDQTKIPQIENMEVQAIKSSILAKDSTIVGLKLSVASLDRQITALKSQLDNSLPNASLALLSQLHDV